MFTRLAATGVAIATLALAVPAAAQTASDDARFQQAQARFAREMTLFRQEFDRYQAARSNNPGYPPPPGYDDRGNGGYRSAPDPRYQDSGYSGDSYAERDENGYDPSRYYRSGGNYQEQTLSANDRVYAGSDGRYYCKHNDGTTGLVIGGVAGGVLGNVIQGGHSRLLGTLVGGAAGAFAGKAIDQSGNQVRCR